MVNLRTHKAVVLAAIAGVLATIALNGLVKSYFVPLEDLWLAMADGTMWISTIGFAIYLFMGYALRKHQLLADELRRLLHRDALTDVGTRDAFFEAFEITHQRQGVSLMIDIDYFKRINDTHGHLAGDAVIRDVAARLRANLRNSDIICRFGGEEFLVFLDRADLALGETVAERMRTSVADEIFALDGVDIFVTVSIGGAMKKHDDDIQRAIKAADDALYRAKNGGRNRTVFAE